MAAQPQNPEQAIDLMGPITITQLVLMLALAAAAILIIWYGALLRRRRKRAEAQVENNFEVAQEKGATAQAATSVDAEGVATRSADVPQPAPAPAPDPTPAPAPANGTAIAADLTQIKGLGPKVAALLVERGVTHVDQLAALGPDEAAALDAALGSFRGRMARDRWVEQARLLSAGDRTGYEAAFGKLGGAGRSGLPPT